MAANYECEKSRIEKNFDEVSLIERLHHQNTKKEKVKKMKVIELIIKTMELALEAIAKVLSDFNQNVYWVMRGIIAWCLVVMALIGGCQTHSWFTTTKQEQIKQLQDEIEAEKTNEVENE